MNRRVIRATKVEIDTAKPAGENWVRAELQQLEVDDENNIISEGLPNKQIYRRVADVALEGVTFDSPVTGESITLTIADIGVAIKTAFIGWECEDFNATFDGSIGWVVLDDGTG